MLNSTEQTWSGGIAGKHGVNYSFSIEFSKYKKEPVPDTLWIDKHPIPLSLQNIPRSQSNTKVIRKKKTVQYEINAGVSFDDYEYRFANPEQMETETESKKKVPNPPITYKGVALLSYQYKGKQQYFVIPKIMKIFPPVNYP